VLTRTIFLLTSTILLVAACHGKPGDDCTETPGSCLDKTSHLVCVNKKYILETCQGKGGCNDEGKTLLCDNSMAHIGDGCDHDGERACSTDGTAELRCRDSKMQTEWNCRGGCTLDPNGNPKCLPTGEVGDACRPGSIVCDGKKKTQLTCTDGKLAASRTCNGADGCITDPGGGVRCDRTIALEGEKCTEEDKGACDVTKKNVLVCTGGRFKTTMKCGGALGCELPGNYSVRCDKSLVPADEPCDDEGAVTCTTDGAQVKCTSGKWVKDKNWHPKPGEACNNRYRISKETEKFEAR
jgi:hypothetical protein